jgi:dihydrofolate reductase
MMQAPPPHAMRPLTYFVACTADGFIADADGGFGAFLAEGDHIADQCAEYPETIPGHFRAPLGIDAPNRHFDTVLMGRATYEVGLPLGVTSPYPHMAQYVFSGTTAPASPDVHHVRDDALATVRALKREPGLGIWLCGGGRLAATLLPVIDLLVLKVHPVLLGDGIPLFAAGTSHATRMLLERSHVHASGVVRQHYRLTNQAA